MTSKALSSIVWNEEFAVLYLLNTKSAAIPTQEVQSGNGERRGTRVAVIVLLSILLGANKFSEKTFSNITKKCWAAGKSFRETLWRRAYDNQPESSRSYPREQYVPVALARQGSSSLN
jgi:hypothetical protein